MYIKDEKFVEDYLKESLKIAKQQLSYNKKIITVQNIFLSFLVLRLSYCLYFYGIL